MLCATGDLFYPANIHRYWLCARMLCDQPSNSPSPTTINRLMVIVNMDRGLLQVRLALSSQEVFSQLIQTYLERSGATVVPI